MANPQYNRPHQSHVTLYLIVIGFFMLLISGTFLTEGISRAGLDTAVVSQRMSDGFEDFWLPSLQTPGNPARQNYLPLGYWMESVWFSLFGTGSFLAEKVYSVLTFIIIGLLMIWCWCLLGNTRRTGWIPLLCWMTIPLVSWSATNNLLESTMTIFVLLSVVFLMKGRNLAFVLASMQAAGRKVRVANYHLGRIGWTILAALMMELAFMVKGVTGLFPIFFPLMYWFFVRREKITIPICAMLVVFFTWAITLFVVMLSSQDVYDHIYNYLHNQLIGGVLHVRTVASRFFIFGVLVVQMVIPICILAVLSLLRFKQHPLMRYIFFWRNKSKMTANQKHNAQMGWFFAAVGVSGVFPIMLGFKQQEFYLVPTLPFFAIAVGCFVLNMVDDWLERINRVAQRVLQALAALVFGGGLLLNLNSINKVSNNHELLEDMRYILPMLEKGETVSVTAEIMQEQEIEEYFYRYKEIVFDTTQQHPHLLSLYTAVSNPHYAPVDLATTNYKLYELKPFTTDESEETEMCNDSTLATPLSDTMCLSAQPDLLQRHL